MDYWLKIKKIKDKLLYNVNYLSINCINYNLKNKPL